MIKRFFSTYRHEGNVDPVFTECVYPIMGEGVELEPYAHPYEVPSTNAEVISMYGDPGYEKLNPKWERRNMVLVKNLPGTFNKGRNRIYCHRKMAPAVREVFRRCEIYGILDEIETMGCFNHRMMKSNSAKLSRHARGAALDINHRRNAGRFYRRSRRTPAPEPWSEEWMKVWPNGVSKKLVQAFKEAGFRWGGDWKWYKDPTHFEYVHIHPEVPIEYDVSATE